MRQAPQNSRHDIFEPRAGPLGQARWFVGAFLLSLTVGVLAVAGLCVYVNPWGNYGDTGYPWLYNARLAKTEFLKSLPPGELPPVVVLGSSNLMRYRPELIEERLGMKAFNLATFWGRSEDFYCLTHFLVDDLDHVPEVLIVGIDTWTFEPMQPHPARPGYRRRLLNTPSLQRHLPDVGPARLAVSRAIDALSYQQILDSWRAMRSGKPRERQAELEQSHIFATDGTRLHYAPALEGLPANLLGPVDSGELSISAAMERRAAEAASRLPMFSYYQFTRLSEHRIRMLRQTLENTDRLGVRVVFVMNPVHPVLMKALMSTGPHRENLEAVRALLAELASAHASVAGIVDAVDLESFGGDPEGFYDGMHLATRNCDRIVERIAEVLGD